jgi:cellulose synthase/poly-beta-1,6-N-acetylglucosamine synthase-like glycosyltransferase
VIVIDNGSGDGTRPLVESVARSSPLPVRYLNQDENRRISRARNLAIAQTSSPICLFLSDDIWADESLLARHADFHRRHLAPEYALLGRMSTPAAASTPFMRWLDASGMRAAYNRIGDRSEVPWMFFMAGNLSAKSEFITSVGGFDESYLVGWEDIELGLRLKQRGLRLHYDPNAFGEHFHPLGLPDALTLLRTRGREQARHAERLSELPMPKPPSLRFRLMAGCLTALNLLPLRPAFVRRATWYFLCYEAGREGFWNPQEPDDAPLQVGRRLARLACRDPLAQSPDRLRALPTSR